MEFAQPPPNLALPPPNMGVTPQNLSMPPPNLLPVQGGFHGNKPPFRPFMNMQRPLPGPLGNMTLEDFDGKRLRKSVMRKTVDYNSSIIKALETRVWQRDYRDRRALQPDVMYYPDLMPPPSYPDNPINCVTTRFVKTATNKMRCPIFCMAWTPEGRRLVTGASSGEFTLWNGLTFNFETILQAHDSPVRTMVWSHNDSWMVTGDHAGYVKYWQSNMNNVKMFQAHKEALRGISFSPSDTKFVTCSDDGTLRIWDFFRYQEEKILRGHGADVKCVHWHPQKALIVSGSKDNQQPIKLWDPKTGQSLATLHAHKSTVMDLKWNENGNWLITASRDHLLKLFDIRNLSQEVQTFRGHKKEASSVAWHPIHEGLFCSGGSDGSIMFWHVGADKEVGAIEQAHDSIVWTLAWHPLGHILCSGSNDHTSKFWTRNRPGDLMRDKYNLNTLPAGIAGLEDMDITGDEPSIIPGMGPEDKVEYTSLVSDDNATIPGLDLDNITSLTNEEKGKSKKVPFSKPIPRNFQAQWNETYGPDAQGTLNEVISQIVENTPGVVPLQKIAPSAIIIYGKLIPVERCVQCNPVHGTITILHVKIFKQEAGSKLETAISEGPDALQKYIRSGEIEELHDVMPIGDEDEDYLNDYDDDDVDNPNNKSSSNQNSKNNNNASSNNQQEKNNSSGLFGGDLDMRPMDQDMRMVYNPAPQAGHHNNMGGRDSDMRNMDPGFRNNFQDVDFRHANDSNSAGPPPNSRDFDMRHNNSRPGPPPLLSLNTDLRMGGSGGGSGGRMGDEDFRQFPSPNEFRPPGAAGGGMPSLPAPNQRFNNSNNSMQMNNDGIGGGGGGHGDGYNNEDFQRDDYMNEDFSEDFHDDSYYEDTWPPQRNSIGGGGGPGGQGPGGPGAGNFRGGRGGGGSHRGFGGNHPGNFGGRNQGGPNNVGGNQGDDGSGDWNMNHNDNFRTREGGRGRGGGGGGPRPSEGGDNQRRGGGRGRGGRDGPKGGRGGGRGGNQGGGDRRGRGGRRGRRGGGGGGGRGGGGGGGGGGF